MTERQEIRITGVPSSQYRSRRNRSFWRNELLTLTVFEGRIAAALRRAAKIRMSMQNFAH